MKKFWKWLWWSPGLLMSFTVVAHESEPRVYFVVGEESTGRLHMRLEVPEGGVYSGRYSSLDRVVVDIPRDLQQGVYDLRFGPTPTPVNCSGILSSCPGACPPAPRGDLVRIDATECLPTTSGPPAWQGNVTSQGRRIEGTWACSPVEPDDGQPGPCRGEVKR